MIAIKGMDKMPKNCISCPLYVGKTGEGYCAITHKWNATGGLNRLDDCPLIEIVTCKDCKYLKVYNFGYTCELGRWNTISKSPNCGGMGDFWCKDGERKK